MGKTQLTISEQVRLLKERGLKVADFEECGRFLQMTNYYRFSGYFRYWQSDPLHGSNTFIPGADFDTIRGVYEAEQEFSSECSRALHQIEIILRANFAYYCSFNVSGCGLVQREGFSAPRESSLSLLDHLIVRDLNLSKEAFVQHYRAGSAFSGDNKFTAENYTNLPSWVAVEALSFGTLSRCIEASELSGDISEIARSLGVAKKTFVSQVRSFVYLRNRCAHNLRLWNHSVLNPPKVNNNISNRAKRKYGTFGDRSVFRILVCLERVLSSSGVAKGWLDKRIMPLLDANPELKRGILTPHKYGDYTPSCGLTPRATASP